jgi:predicted dehydrogenase
LNQGARITAPGRALLVGCGNIGALYDLDDAPDADVRTHARAYARLGIAFDVVEPDADRRRTVAERYGARAFESLDAIAPDAYSVASICSATHLHAEALRLFLDAGTPLVICEKPVADQIDDVRALRVRRSSAARSVVLVNYMRRFLPAFHRLRERIVRWREEGVRLVDVVLRYQRGLLNNGGHALDLLEFFFDRPVKLAGLRVDAAVTDAFAADPTVSGTFDFLGATVKLEGLSPPPPGIFELDLVFADRRVQVLDRGDEIRVSMPNPSDDGPQLDPAASEKGCLANYMLPIFERGLALVTSGRKNDENFDQAARLNEEILVALAGIRSRS